MQSYPIDVEPEQLVRWFIAEREGGGSRFEAVAGCVRETRELPVGKEFRLGDEAREDLSETVTVATLKITPFQRSDGWSLSVVVEDDLGPPVSDEDRETEDGGEEIDLDTFYSEFIAPGRGSANVVADVQSPAAKQRLSTLLAEIARDRHDERRGESSLDAG